MRVDNFAARLAKAKLTTTDDISDFLKKKKKKKKKKTDIDEKLKNINKKVTSNKMKNVEAKKKLTDLTEEIAQISEKGYDFLLGRMYFTDDDGCQNF